MTGDDATASQPSLRAVLVLAIAALALVATSPAAPTLEGYVIGEVALTGGQTLERTLRVHVEPEGGGAERGSITVAPQAANGLLTSGGMVAISVGGAHPQPDGIGNFPVALCLEGCDLSFPITIHAAPDVLPGSIARYEVAVRLQYDYGFAPLPDRLLRLELDGQSSGPIAPLWSLLAGVLALAAGIVVGPRADAWLGPRRRTWPASALAVLIGGTLAWLVIRAVSGLAQVPGFDPFSALLLLADPWSVALLVALGWGVVHGLGRWPDEGGTTLGLAAVAAAGLGGLWLAWRLTIDAAVQPIVLAIPFVVLGAVAGVVIGQAWRADPRKPADPGWLALGVLGHGIVVAGFGFLAPSSMGDPVGRATPISWLALIPAALIAVAFRRWLRGKQGWLLFLDLPVMLVGFLGLFLWTTAFVGFTTSPDRLEIDDVAVAIAVAASVAAFVSALHSRRPYQPPPAWVVDEAGRGAIASGTLEAEPQP